MFQRKQHARLGEYVASGGSYQLAWASWAATTPPPPIFSIKWHGGLRKKGSTPLALKIHLQLVRRRRKKKKIQAEMLS